MEGGVVVGGAVTGGVVVGGLLPPPPEEGPVTFSGPVDALDPPELLFPDDEPPELLFPDVEPLDLLVPELEPDFAALLLEVEVGDCESELWLDVGVLDVVATALFWVDDLAPPELEKRAKAATITSSMAKETGI